MHRDKLRDQLNVIRQKMAKQKDTGIVEKNARPKVKNKIVALSQPTPRIQKTSRFVPAKQGCSQCSRKIGK